uniref:N-acetyltransferase n=1 Tax=Borely moumouvirus TaxID=2712067 RepID=A0A6G6ABV3_9VIRU
MSRDYDNTNQDENIKCRSGEILRKGYHRKGFERREFVRSNGTIVPASYIPETYVPPTCVKDMGKPGKGPKILPTPRGDIHFRDYGYDVHKPDRERQQALIDASNDYNPLTVLRRMNLIRNYQPVPENKERMSRDVEFLSNYYAKIKEMDSNNENNGKSYRSNNRSRRSNSRSRRSNNRSKRLNYRSKRSNNQKGGIDNETSDENINSNLPIQHIDKENTLYSQSKNCEDGKCSVINRVKEQHIVDGRKIVYYTVDENDANEILKLDKMYLDSDRTIDQVVKDINKYKGFIIGIKVDEILQGYCQYKEIDNNKVKIVWFCANKGFGTPLYIFMEKYFQLNNYNHIVLTSSLEDKYSTRRLNFWYKMGFRSNGISDKKQITMDKNI